MPNDFVLLTEVEGETGEDVAFEFDRNQALFEGWSLGGQEVYRFYPDAGSDSEINVNNDDGSGLAYRGSGWLPGRHMTKR